MSKEIQVLKQTELLGHQFAVYGTAEEPLFRAKDVAEFIEHKNITHLLALVDDDEKGVTEYVTPGGNQEVWMLTDLVEDEDVVILMILMMQLYRLK